MLSSHIKVFISFTCFISVLTILYFIKPQNGNVMSTAGFRVLIFKMNKIKKRQTQTKPDSYIQVKNWWLTDGGWGEWGK